MSYNNIDLIIQKSDPAASAMGFQFTCKKSQNEWKAETTVFGLDFFYPQTFDNADAALTLGNAVLF